MPADRRVQKPGAPSPVARAGRDRQCPDAREPDAALAVLRSTDVGAAPSRRAARSRRPWRVARLVPLLLGAVISVAAVAQQAAPPTPPPPAPQGGQAGGDGENPEYRTRALPTDSFKPSEQVSEDFAVPFPADI